MRMTPSPCKHNLAETLPSCERRASGRTGPRRPACGGGPAQSPSRVPQPGDRSSLPEARGSQHFREPVQHRITGMNSKLHLLVKRILNRGGYHTQCAALAHLSVARSCILLRRSLCILHVVRNIIALALQLLNRCVKLGNRCGNIR